MHWFTYMHSWRPASLRSQPQSSPTAHEISKSVACLEVYKFWYMKFSLFGSTLLNYGAVLLMCMGSIRYDSALTIYLCTRGLSSNHAGRGAGSKLECNMLREHIRGPKVVYKDNWKFMHALREIRIGGFILRTADFLIQAARAIVYARMEQMPWKRPVEL